MNTTTKIGLTKHIILNGYLECELLKEMEYFKDALKARIQDGLDVELHLNQITLLRKKLTQLNKIKAKLI